MAGRLESKWLEKPSINPTFSDVVQQRNLVIHVCPNFPALVPSDDITEARKRHGFVQTACVTPTRAR